MRLQSSSDAAPGPTVATDRDGELTRFARSIVDAARREWPDRLIVEGNRTFDPRLLYTETHYALAAVLLFLSNRSERGLLDVAESRLRLWASGPVPLTFFNAMAICLAAILLKRSGEAHPALQSILDELLANTREHRNVAYPQWCGNNAYLQQVAVDTVLLPVARGREVTAEGRALLLREFRSFRTPEGLFFDLPRRGNEQEPLCPPTYIMKMLFLLGVCHELHPASELLELFATGVARLAPLVTRDGTISYFGRTDNSPFGVGLTIFNFRKAAATAPGARPDYDDACRRAERFYLTFPRAASGVLESNRFADPSSIAETWLSKDAYAYVAQYSLASCAYALLGRHWFPSERCAEPPGDPVRAAPPPAVSIDLGVVKLRCDRAELVVRTRSEMTSWDRRYLGPAILRYSIGDKLLVGAISRTVSTDPTAVTPAAGRMGRLFGTFRNRYRAGDEHLDGTSVGFLPVVRRGTVDYVPYLPSSIDVNDTEVTTRHQMQRVTVRGLVSCVGEARRLAHGVVPGLQPLRYLRPRMRPEPSMELLRRIVVTSTACSVEDRISGELSGKEILFSVRRMPGTSVRVDGMTKLRSMTGWGSDGRQALDIYGARSSGTEFRYACEISEAS